MPLAGAKLVDASETCGSIESDNMDSAEQKSPERLIRTYPPNSGPVIAIDLDDVLSQTNHEVAKWHNEIYGTEMTVEHFYYYYYWKNPFWGTSQETFEKVQRFYETSRIFNADVVPGAIEGVQTLKNMGYRLVIVTARTVDIQEQSWRWVNEHFPECFTELICTGQFKDAGKVGHEVVTNLNKAEVCLSLGARLLVDDSAENAIQCATHGNATRVLLFGQYQWNQRLSGHSADDRSYEERLLAEGGKEFWKEEKLMVPKGAPLERVKDWSEVVRWVKMATEAGVM